MGRRLSSTPRSKVKGAIRQLWLRSRERAAALKGTGYRCRNCDIKQSVAKGKEVKLQVHHDPPIDWEGVVDLIFERILNVPQYPLCKECHKKEHEGKFMNESRKVQLQQSEQPDALSGLR